MSRGVLSASDRAERRLLRLLQDSVGFAFNATTALQEDIKPVFEACRQARESIAHVCDEMSTWIGQASTDEATEETG
jgi:hypothetical protein